MRQVWVVEAVAGAVVVVVGLLLPLAFSQSLRDCNPVYAYIHEKKGLEGCVAGQYVGHTKTSPSQRVELGWGRRVCLCFVPTL